MIEARNVSKIYGTQKALDKINLTINDGEFLVIMGPSGSGKSTTLNLFAGIDQPTSGEINIDGTNIANMKQKELELFRQKKMGFIFQDYHILNSLNATENIVLPLIIQKVKRKEIDLRLKTISKELGIEKLLDKPVYQLSGGEKQRVAIARALITKPEIVYADEPTGALDSKNAHNLLKILEYQNIEHHQTMMMVTHDAFSASFGSRVIFIKDGKLFKEIKKNNASRKAFYEAIIKITTELGGDLDVI
ncbi:MAG: ABC transporter ATP-binding protein [Bacilli bacterium]|jgi:putative ABC transport system ATP-binding protein|nr:ABC transporter ATP-binding protein [Bacilli bacterium]